MTSSAQGTNFYGDVMTGVAELVGGYKMIWENTGPLVENRDTSLRFKLITPDNRLAMIQPYMGMPGHAVVRRRDGTVFAHIHPVGTFSMAAQEFFVKDKLSPHSPSNQQAVASSGEQEKVATQLHQNHMNSMGLSGEVSFPYAFPKPGAYRVWVQIKSQGQIFTGTFDTAVAAAK
jgi:hypothetical protein